MSCNCNETGCGCGCDGGVSTEVTIQQGDTFSLQFEYKEDDVPLVIPEGYDLICGIYDSMGALIQYGKISEGTVVPYENGTYLIEISHESSMRMVGEVSIELTLVDTDGRFVDHASDIVYMSAEPRNNNQLIK